MATSIVAHEFPIRKKDIRSVDTEVTALASWIRSRTKKAIKGDQRVDFRTLRRLLEAYGAEFGQPTNNYIKIHLGGYSVKTGYPSEHFTVPVNEVKRIRKALQLDYNDSREFYDLPAVVDDFVYQYRNVLYRLADA